jgi:acrylyl-CoA reductase (NADPH)
MQAFWIREGDESLHLGVEETAPPTPAANEVLVQVDFSGVNFKDALVAQHPSRVRRVPALIGGVDAAGTITHSEDPRLPIGTRVAVHGGELGVARMGGFAEYIATPTAFVSVLPGNIDSRLAMIIGTAGYTAMASILALEHHGLAPDAEVLVTGATGGVGSQSVSYLRARGYAPVASTGSVNLAAWLSTIGAARVIGRNEIADKPDRVLGTERWDGAIDCVGGTTLHQILRSLRYGAAVAASGLVGSAELATNVYPFITRGVALLGIDAVQANAAQRAAVWGALSAVVATINMDQFVDRTVTLGELPEALEVIRNGKTQGRILVNPTLG